MQRLAIGGGVTIGIVTYSAYFAKIYEAAASAAAASEIAVGVGV
jgi:hypothetical protein